MPNSVSRYRLQNERQRYIKIEARIARFGRFCVGLRGVGGTAGTYLVMAWGAAAACSGLQGAQAFRRGQQARGPLAQKSPKPHAGKSSAMF